MVRRDVALVPGSLRGTRTVACPAPFRAVRGLRSVPQSFPLAHNWDCPLAWVPETAPVSKLGPLLRKQAGSSKNPASPLASVAIRTTGPVDTSPCGSRSSGGPDWDETRVQEATQERSLQAVQRGSGDSFLDPDGRLSWGAHLGAPRVAVLQNTKGTA